MDEKELNFEDCMRRLEEIVSGLERNEVSLQDSMALFEEGTALIRRCTELLDNAELKVTKLTQGPDGAPAEQPFERKKA